MQQFFPPNDFKNRTLQNVSRTFAGQYLPPNRFPNFHFTKFGSQTIRTSRTFPLLPAELKLQIPFLQDIFAPSICLKIVSQTQLLQDKGTRKPPQSRTFVGHIAPKSFSMREFCKIPAFKTIRTNPTFPPLKSTITPQLIG
jgi:hypothetical protein